MHYFLTGIFFFSTYLLFGQKMVEFSDPLPPDYKLAQAVDKDLYGDYRNEATGTIYHFDETGISIVTRVIAYVTREQVRESSKIQARNGMLYGVVPNDSVPYVEEGERYYYGIRNAVKIAGEGSGNQLTRIDTKTYVLNFLEGTFFEPSMLTFGPAGLSIVHANLDYRDEYDRLLKTNTVTKYNTEIVILAPADTQWSWLKPLLFGGEKLAYAKVSE